MPVHTCVREGGGGERERERERERARVSMDAYIYKQMLIQYYVYTCSEQVYMYGKYTSIATFNLPGQFNAPGSIHHRRQVIQ